MTYADVQIAGKTHHDQGMLKSFAEQISYAKSKPTLLAVTVNLDKWTGMCSSLEYSLEVAGTTHRSPAYDGFDQHKLPRAIAFAPEADSGVILAGGPLQGDLVTEFGTDDVGRRFIRRQAFVIDGVTYQVSYSDYGYKGPPTGKLASFTATINALPK